jgi:hypothetical protein
MRDYSLRRSRSPSWDQGRSVLGRQRELGELHRRKQAVLGHTGGVGAYRRCWGIQAVLGRYRRCWGDNQTLWARKQSSIGSSRPMRLYTARTNSLSPLAVSRSTTAAIMSWPPSYAGHSERGMPLKLKLQTPTPNSQRALTDVRCGKADVDGRGLEATELTCGATDQIALV